MENIPVPPYPGPPLESTSSEQRRAYSYQPAPHSQHTGGQQSPGPQYLSSLPMENIPTPPYSGPPLDSELSSWFQQRGSMNQTVPRTQHTTEELPHGPQSLRSLPIENIPAPPYPGPPLNSQATSSVQQRSCIHQPVSQTRHTTEEDGPCYNLLSHGIQSLRHSPMENIPSPPYYGLPSSSAPQRAFTQTTDLDNPGMKISKGRELKGVLCQHSDSHSGPTFHSQHAKQSPACPEKEEIKRILYDSMPLETKSHWDLKERVCSQEGVAQTHCAPVQMKNNGMGAFSMEKMSSSLPRNAALKQQEFTCVHKPQMELNFCFEKRAAEISKSTTEFKEISPLPMENVPAPPYPGPLLGSSGYQTGFTHQPSPYKDHDNSGVETSKGLERGEGVACQLSDAHSGPTFYPQYAKQSPACPEKEEIKRILYDSMPLETKSHWDLKERVCSQEGVAQTHCAPVQMKNNGMGAFSMEKMSTSLPHNAALKRQDFTCVHKPQAELPPSSQKKPAEIKHTTEFKKISSTSLSMENIPVPPYPGPPLESTSSGQQRANSYQPAPHSQHTSVQQVLYNPQKSPQPQHYSSLPMENISAASYPGSPLGFQLTGSVQQLGITYQSAPEIHPTAAEGALHNQLYSLQHQRAASASTTQYPGHTMNLQPFQPVQELSSATSVSKYSYYSTGAVQPEVQMVQQGGTHVMVQPFPQPALMVRPASQPAVMVQPSPQPTVVVQPATPTVRVIQPQVFQAAANAIVYHRYY